MKPALKAISCGLLASFLVIWIFGWYDRNNQRYYLVTPGGSIGIRI